MKKEKSLQKAKNSNEYKKLPILDGVEVLNAQNCTVNFPFHKHNTYNISLVLKNTFQTNLESKSFTAPVGSLAITNAEEVHATPCDAMFGNSFFTFYIPPTALKQLSSSNKISFDRKVIDDPNICNEFLWLSRNLDSGQEVFENRLINALKSLIKEHSVSKTTETTHSKVSEFIHEAIQSQDFSLEQISAKYGVNKYKFLRLFKEETGLTPKRFLLLQQIEKSKTMLRKGHSIFEVAISCGFYDCPHFYKYFKQYTGVNPLEFQAAFTSI